MFIKIGRMSCGKQNKFYLVSQPKTYNMKKLMIAGIVGGLILFVWQTLSNTVLNTHTQALQYTSKQDSIMSFLNQQLDAEGRYLMPRLPEGASMDDYNAHAKEWQGKPWAIISYKKSQDTNMVMNMIRTLLVDFVVVWLLAWILLKIPQRRMGTIFFATLFTGIIIFLNSFYTQYIWYQEAGLNGYLIDALISWGLCGLWLGKYLKTAK
jgi:hypothetical protein